MALVEHEYIFNDSRIDESTLLPETLDALQRYDFDYRQNELGYFQRLESKLKSYSAREGSVLIGRRKQADMVYAKAGEPQDSREDAVLWHNSWGQSVAPRSDSDEIFEHASSESGTGADSNSWNKLILADFMYFALKHAGIRDKTGDALPVISIPSPSLDRRGFTAKSKANPLGKLAIAAINLGRIENVKQVHAGGVSQGASVSAELAKRGQGHFSIESVFLGELPNAVTRYLPRFGKDYLTDGSNIEGDYTEDGPASRREIAKGKESSRMLRQVAGNGNIRTNWRLVKDMRRGGVSGFFDSFAERKLPTTIEYGTYSNVSAGVPELFYQPECSLKDKGLLQILKAVNAPHIHSEHIVQTIDAMLRSVKFARDSN